MLLGLFFYKVVAIDQSQLASYNLHLAIFVVLVYSLQYPEKKLQMRLDSFLACHALVWLAVNYVRLSLVLRV